VEAAGNEYAGTKEHITQQSYSHEILNRWL